VAEFTKKTGQTMLKGGEGGSGDDETTAKTGCRLLEDDDQKGRQFLREK